jgi:hypothetical protein
MTPEEAGMPATAQLGCIQQQQKIFHTAVEEVARKGRQQRQERRHLQAHQKKCYQRQESL